VCGGGGDTMGRNCYTLWCWMKLGAWCRSSIVLYTVCIIYIPILYCMFTSAPPSQHYRIPCPKRGCRFLSVRARKLKTIQQIIDFYLANGLFHFRHLHSKEFEPTVSCTAIPVDICIYTLLTQLETYTHTRAYYKNII